MKRINIIFEFKIDFKFICKRSQLITVHYYFTLIVIIILAVLAAVALPQFINILRDTKIAILSAQQEGQRQIAYLKVQIVKLL